MFQQFINREEELELLEKRFRSGKPEFVVIYGRRRVGKTELAVKFIKNKPGIYFLAEVAALRKKNSATGNKAG